MFDSVNLKEAINDIFDYGVKDDELHLIYQVNNKVYMAIKTPGGLTDRQTINNCLLQGDTWSSIVYFIRANYQSQCWD